MTGGLYVFITRLQHSDMRHEIARYVKTCHLDTIFIIFYLLKQGSSDTLGSFTLVVARKHAVDISAVHRPETLAHVHGKRVARWNHQDALAVGYPALALQILQNHHHPGADILLLNLVTSHGTHYGKRLLAAAKEETVNIEIVTIR